MAAELLPVALLPGQEARLTAPYVHDVARLAERRPVPAVVPDGAERAAAVLAWAAMAAGPFLVLPAPATTLPDHLQHVLVPVDRSVAEGATVGSWVRRAEHCGLLVRRLHVLGPDALPVMWEGAGHHAEAWREAIARRYGTRPSELTVRPGVPPDQLRAACADADLVLACWAGDAAVDRATTLRTLLVGCPAPVLLVRRPVPDGAGVVDRQDRG